MYSAVTTGCGLDHGAVYSRNTGKRANAQSYDKFMRGCDQWRLSIDRVAGHDVVARLWDAHLADLGTE